MDVPEPLFDQEWLAKRLGTTIKMLEQRRYRGDFVPFIKIGRLVRYRKSDVEQWIENNVKTTTPHIPRLTRKKIMPSYMTDEARVPKKKNRATR